jgi:hypothetical protein
LLEVPSANGAAFRRVDRKRRDHFARSQH